MTLGEVDLSHQLTGDKKVLKFFPKVLNLDETKEMTHKILAQYERRCGTDSCYITQYGKLNATYCVSIQLDEDTTGNR